MEKHGQRTYSTKMDADSLAENTPNAPELFCPFVCPNPKVLDFNEKRLHWGSAVRGCKDLAVIIIARCTFTVVILNC